MHLQVRSKLPGSAAAHAAVRVLKTYVQCFSVTYCYLTNDHTLSSLRQHTFITSVALFSSVASSRGHLLPCLVFIISLQFLTRTWSPCPSHSQSLRLREHQKQPPVGAPGRQRAAGAAGGDHVSLAAPPRLLSVGCGRNDG